MSAPTIEKLRAQGLKHAERAAQAFADAKATDVSFLDPGPLTSAHSQACGEMGACVAKSKTLFGAVASEALHRELFRHKVMHTTALFTLEERTCLRCSELDRGLPQERVEHRRCDDCGGWFCEMHLSHTHSCVKWAPYRWPWFGPPYHPSVSTMSCGTKHAGNEACEWPWVEVDGREPVLPVERMSCGCLESDGCEDQR